MVTESNRSRTSLRTLAVIAFLVILAGFVYLGSRLRAIEERLGSFSVPPVTEQQIAAHRPAAEASRTVYVPAYSHVYSHGGLPYLLEVTLSVRNTDPQTNLTLTRADYYDTEGKMLRRFITAPTQLTPLKSESFVVEKTDYKGGSGANFIVEWSADKPISKPVIEAVMIGVDPEYQISFLREGIPVERFKH